MAGSYAQARCWSAPEGELTEGFALRLGHGTGEEDDREVLLLIAEPRNGGIFIQTDASENDPRFEMHEATGERVTLTLSLDGDGPPTAEIKPFPHRPAAYKRPTTSEGEG